jgi:hypothetical protein
MGAVWPESVASSKPIQRCPVACMSVVYGTGGQQPQAVAPLAESGCQRRQVGLQVLGLRESP